MAIFLLFLLNQSFVSKKKRRKNVNIKTDSLQSAEMKENQKKVNEKKKLKHQTKGNYDDNKNVASITLPQSTICIITENSH